MARAPWLSAPRQLAIAAGIGIAVLSVLDGDDRRGGHPRRQPSAALDHFRVRRHYRLRQVGLVSLAARLVFLALAALPPVLTPFSQRVLAAIMVRVGFLFTAIAVPSLFVTIIKRMIGRARPMVGGSLDPFLFSPFSWQRGLCRHAVGTRHDGFRRAGRFRDAVAARPHGLC